MSELIPIKAIEGVAILTRHPHADERGTFDKLFGRELCSRCHIDGHVQQVNMSSNLTSGTVRGMHMQTAPHAEWKIVTCIKGSVLDVLIDVRRGSRTFLCSHYQPLDGPSFKSLFVPKGVLHGFQTLEPDTTLVYMHSEYYEPDLQTGLNPFDPILNIDWPLDVTLCSEHDRSLPMVEPKFRGFTV